MALLVLGFPGQMRRSLRRWFADEAPPPLTKPSSASADALATRIRRLVRPTLLIVPAADPGFSKLGGDPELPREMAWPQGRDRPRTFIGQIDLEAVAQRRVIDWLPDEGRLYAFYDPEGHGFADVVRIVHCTEPSGPAGPAPKGAKRLPERRIDFIERTSAPSLEWLGLDAAELGLVEDEYQMIEEIGDAPPSGEVQHRIGGYPNEIQPERLWLRCEHFARGLPEAAWDEDVSLAIRRAAKKWRLLLQIDSDPGLKMNFGDGGRLYVFIRERDARRGDFNGAVTLWQTY